MIITFYACIYIYIYICICICIYIYRTDMVVFMVATCTDYHMTKKRQKYEGFFLSEKILILNYFFCRTCR